MNHPASGFAIGSEAHEWRGEADRSASRRRRLSARGPYRSAVPARIAGLPVLLDAAVQAEAEDAVREITRFDAEVTAMSARRVQVEGETTATELAPLAAVLLRTESASSSDIEGVTAGARALALAAIEARTGPNAQLVTANVTAMQRAVELGRRAAHRRRDPRPRRPRPPQPGVAGPGGHRRPRRLRRAGRAPRLTDRPIGVHRRS